MRSRKLPHFFRTAKLHSRRWTSWSLPAGTFDIACSSCSLVKSLSQLLSMPMATSSLSYEVPLFLNFILILVTPDIRVHIMLQ